jgi:hypothetical protein
MKHVLKISFATAVVAVGLFGAREARAQGNQENPGIVPPKARLQGLSYSQWQARWEKWVDSLPASTHPFNPGGSVLQGQTGNVWFLTGTGSFTPEVRDITIPTGKFLLFPILAVECSTVESPPFHGDNEAELRAGTKFFMDRGTGLSAEIDGVPVNNVGAYRRQSTVVSFTLPDDNIFGVPAGTSGHSVDDGVFLMVKPLSVGSHTIHFYGVFDLTDIFGITLTQDTTSNITVAP